MLPPDRRASLIEFFCTTVYPQKRQTHIFPNLADFAIRTCRRTTPDAQAMTPEQALPPQLRSHGEYQRTNSPHVFPILLLEPQLLGFPQLVPLKKLNLLLTLLPISDTASGTLTLFQDIFILPSAII